MIVNNADLNTLILHLQNHAFKSVVMEKGFRYNVMTAITLMVMDAVLTVEQKSDSPAMEVVPTVKTHAQNTNQKRYNSSKQDKLTYMEK